VQSVPFTTSVASSNPTHGEVYVIQHYMMNMSKFMSTYNRVRNVALNSTYNNITVTYRSGQFHWCWKPEYPVKTMIIKWVQDYEKLNEVVVVGIIW
jgi:hypothetical protein